MDWTFELNNKPMSVFASGVISFPAFSGLGVHVNQRVAACLGGIGPIPPGTYYIFDRQSGGLFGPLKDWLTGRDQWFALHGIDDHIDDEIYCEKVKRGQFRLHPKGPSGRSEGCIVIDNSTYFLHLRTLLKSTSPVAVPGSPLRAYGKVVVT